MFLERRDSFFPTDSEGARVCSRLGSGVPSGRGSWVGAIPGAALRLPLATFSHPLRDAPSNRNAQNEAN
jgi:hypothetical protein